jgi:hypothetical protein
MKHLKKYSESKSTDDEVKRYFLDAYQNSSCSVPDEFPSYASEFYIYDNYYLYDNKIYIFSSRPSGNWYHTEIKLCELKPGDLIKKLEKKLNKIEKAIEKLSYGHDV